MAQLLLTLAVMALLWYGLERNHARHSHLFQRLYGGVDVEDRDAARVRAELRAARDHQDWAALRADHGTDLGHRYRGRGSGFGAVTR